MLLLLDVESESGSMGFSAAAATATAGGEWPGDKEADFLAAEASSGGGSWCKWTEWLGKVGESVGGWADSSGRA